MASSPLNKLLELLPGAKRSGSGYQARCPAHDDSVASLSVKEGTDGRVLLHCHARCSYEAILAAIGLKPSDLFPDKQGGGHTDGESRIAATYDYTDAAGNLLYQAVRFSPKAFRQRRPVDEPGKAGWIWNLKGIDRVLYRLPRVLEAVAAGKPIYIVEGEKDVLTLEGFGLTATCNAGGAGKWLKAYSRVLEGAKVVILPDNDTAGRDHAEKVARSLDGLAAAICVVELPGLPQKGDVSDWVKAGGTADELYALVKAAGDWVPQARGEVEASRFPYTDAGNGERLIAAHGEELRFDVDSGKWIVWTEKYWKPDQTFHVKRLALGVIRSLLDELRVMKEDGERKVLFSHVLQSEGEPRLNAMVSLARTVKGVAVQSIDLDSDKWLLNCLNGTLDLRTGKLQEHRRTDLITKLCPVEYDPAADCPRWMQFLSEVFDGDSELVGFVQRAAGYTLTGDTSEQCFLMLHGGGANGKSTMLTVFRELLSDYHRKVNTGSLLDSDYSGGGGNANPDIARLHGARFVSAIETKPDKGLAEALVKELTGGDAISARHLFREFFDFVPQFKLWLACNHLPKIEGTDYAIWRRVKLVPFAVTFKDSDADSGPYKDGALPDKLRLEYPGILTWMVRGCLEWQAKGLGTAQAVKAATVKYQTDMDWLQEFFVDNCIIGAEAEVKAGLLYEGFRLWSESQGIRKPLTQTKFGRRLEEDGRFRRGRDSTGQRIWVGLRLRGDADPPPEEPKPEPGEDEPIPEPDPEPQENGELDAFDAFDTTSEKSPMKERSEVLIENAVKPVKPVKNERESTPGTPATDGIEVPKGATLPIPKVTCCACGGAEWWAGKDDIQPHCIVCKPPPHPGLVVKRMTTVGEDS